MPTKKKEDKKLTKDQALKKLEILKKDLLNIRFKRINNQVMKVQLGKNKFNKGLLGSIIQAKP